MINFLHTYLPDPILITIGPLDIHWYGLFIVSGILAATVVTFKLAEIYNIKKNIIIDFVFYLIIGGIIGARLYHVMLEISYYARNPLNIFELWQGGLAIHGGIFASVIIIYFLTKKYKLNIFKLTAIFAPGLALAQAIGRWGNYFNQEIFGLPTLLPWGIPISETNRIAAYYNSEYFHPAFLYESIGSLIIFFILISIHIWIVKNKKNNNFYYLLSVVCYLVLYSCLRFGLEFIRIDITPVFFGLRAPQIISLILIAFSVVFLVKFKKNSAPLDKN